MRIGILISGRGSNMLAIVDAVERGEIPDSEVAVVISDKSSAAGLERAKERGIETKIIKRSGRTREEHDAEIIVELRQREVELVCLAGYMRLLSPDFIRSFPNRIVNIHPSLLPSFRGLDAQKQAVEYGVKVSGCTVHFVDEDLDNGAIILQRTVEVLDDDTAETLSARILEQEHATYIEAVRRIAAGRMLISGRKSHLLESVKEKKLLGILRVGYDTTCGEGLSLNDALKRTEYSVIRKSFTVSDLIPLIRENKKFVRQWLAYSGDKRTSGGFWLDDNPIQIGNCNSNESHLFPNSIEEAVANYVIWELDYWSHVGEDRRTIQDSVMNLLKKVR